MRKSLEDLVFVGRIEESFKVYGNDFVLTTLTSSEQLSATAATDRYDNLSRVNALKIEILARSMKKVGDIELNDLQETLDFVGTMQMPMINELFGKYEILQKKQEEALKDLNELKN
ncbi:gp181 [Bacillus phage G]|uniref:Gp181 n=1 Tax=Bacillus phage G TaxID=2884420 RepID=G3MBP8_9CAUD|nr:gp181 [Bacillus phage G]AEO93441.1 gp181 [Bacillus phage G]